MRLFMKSPKKWLGAGDLKKMALIQRELTPRYYRIYEDLYKKIEEGLYREGDKLPSESELCDAYNVSRGTVREALKMLFQQGLLLRERGRGTFVTPQSDKIGQDAQQLIGFTELMKLHHKKATAKLLKIEVEAPKKSIRKLLEIEETDQVVSVERLRFGDHEPLIIERSYFVYDLFHPLIEHDLENQSIYEVLYRETDIRLEDAKQTIEAVLATPADAKLLDIDPGAPLLLIKRIIKTKDGRFFQYSKDLYRSDRLNFIIRTASYTKSNGDFASPLVIGATEDEAG